MHYRSKFNIDLKEVSMRTYKIDACIARKVINKNNIIVVTTLGYKKC